MPSEASTMGGNQSAEELRRELTEAREQQAATARILRAISNSPSDLHGIFLEIATTAARLCDARDAGVLQCAGDHFKLVAHHGSMPAGDRIPLTRGTVMGRAVLDRTVLHVTDLQVETKEYPEGSEIARRDGHRTILGAPLICARAAIGVIFVRRSEVRPFTDRQIELLKTFADQAVIAIENTRLFEAEQTRTKEVEAKSAELRESLEYQTATSDVLNVISRSKSELQPVLDTIVETAARLCRADVAHSRRRESDVYVHVAGYGEPPGFGEYIRETKVELGRGSIVGRVMLEKMAVQIPDVLNDSEFALSEMQRRGNFRTVLGVPLTREGLQVGIIVLLRHVVEPFSEKQVELVTTFANQAVIAIENTRLFEAEQASKRELQESLEYQTATSEVLNVISRSPTELQPVLDAIAATAARLCESMDATLWRVAGGRVRVVAQFGSPTSSPSHPLRRGSVTGRAIVDRKTIHVHDLAAMVETEYPDVKETQQRVGHRSTLATPLLSQGEALGAISVRRNHVQPFSDRQIALLQTFADQAVIAIENARLFESEQKRTRELTERTQELSETLEYQTATSEVLNVISRSPSQLQPVLDTIVETAGRLCQADYALIFRLEHGKYRLIAASNAEAEFVKHLACTSYDADRGSLVGRVAIAKTTIHIPDVLNAPEYARGELQKLGKYRSVLGVPLMRDGQPIGVINLSRTVVQPFTEKQIEVITTFADQAVIAIENARLFNEIAQKSRELEIASQHKSQFVANMSHELRTPLAAMLGYAELLRDGMFGELPEKSIRIIERMQANGKHLLGLINTVLDISKIESGQFNLNLGE